LSSARSFRSNGRSAEAALPFFLDVATQFPRVHSPIPRSLAIDAIGLSPDSTNVTASARYSGVNTLF